MPRHAWKDEEPVSSSTLVMYTAGMIEPRSGESSVTGAVGGFPPPPVTGSDRQSQSSPTRSPSSQHETRPEPFASATHPLLQWLASLSDTRLAFLVALLLFALAAWPLLLVDLPPFQDLPNHVATAHIIAHPDLYPQYVFNGFLKSNSLLTLWFYLVGGHGLFRAARIFTAIVLAASAFALPRFVLHFAGRRSLLVATLFVWPLVHGFWVSMGMLNFALAFALSLILLTVIDRQRECPTLLRGFGIAVFSGVLWYAHPFPLAVVGGLVALHVACRSTWRARIGASLALLLPLAPAGILFLVAAFQHLVKAERASAVTAAGVSYLNPLDIVGHFWLDASGALTKWGSMTIIPALLLPYFAWRRRAEKAGPRPAASVAGESRNHPKVSTSDRRAVHAFFSTLAMAILAAAYVALPFMLSNWWYLNCRLVVFLWAGLALRLPTRLSRPVAILLVTCALSFSAVMGVDYVRLDHDRAAFTAGMDAVPARATLLPLLFKHRKTSDFTASLTHAWAYYTVLRNTSAPLVFAVERSYPITYRAFPPRALIAPALDRFAELDGTPAQVCKSLGRIPVDAACTMAWRERWSVFWRQAEPRFSHLLTWAIPPEARPMIPKRYHRIFAAGELEIYARETPSTDAAPL
jgi:hypothetical protein